MKTRTLLLEASTDGGVQRLLIPGFGTPTLAIITMLDEDTGGFSMGACDGTNQIVSAMQAQNDAPAPNFWSATRGSITKVIQNITELGDITCEASFVQWVEDGLEIQWGFPPINKHTIQVQLFSNVETHVGFVKSAAPVEQQAIVTGIAFEPKSLISFAHGAAFDDTPHPGKAYFSFGYAIESGENNAYVLNSPQNTDVVDTTTPVARLVSNGIYATISDVATEGRMQFDNFTGDGFVVSTKEFSGTMYSAYIAFSEPIKAKVITLPGAREQYQVRFLHTAIAGGIVFQGQPVELNSTVSPGDFAVTAFDKLGSSTIGVGKISGTDPTIVHNYHDLAGPKLVAGNGTVIAEADILAITNQHVLFDFTTLAVEFLWLIIVFPDDVKHFRKIEDACRVSFDGLIGTPEGRVVSYPNTPNADVDTEVQVEFIASDQEDIRGQSSRFGTYGQMRTTLLSNIDQGDGALLTLADEIYQEFLNLEFGIVRFRQPSVKRLGVTKRGKYEIEVLIPFYAPEGIAAIPLVAGTQVEKTSDCAFVTRTRLSDLFPTLFVIYDNFPSNGLPNDLWAECRIVQGNSVQVQLNSRRVFGHVNIAVFCPMETGTLNSLVLIDEIAEQFRTISISGIQFRTPSIVSSRRDRGFWRMDLNCPYFFEEISSV